MRVAFFYQILNVFFGISDHTVLSSIISGNLGFQKSSIHSTSTSTTLSICSKYKNCTACTALLECAWCPSRSTSSTHPQCIEYRNAGFCSEFVYTNSKVVEYPNTCPVQTRNVRQTVLSILSRVFIILLSISIFCCCCACFGCLEWTRWIWDHYLCCPGTLLPHYHGYMSLNDRQYRFPYGTTTTTISSISTGAVLGRGDADYGSTHMSNGRESPRANGFRVQPHYVPGGAVLTTAVPVAEVEMGSLRSPRNRPEKDLVPSAPPMR